MTRNEYEARRRRLDEEMRAAMEILRAGHQTQVQALDLLWRMSAEGGAPPLSPASPPPEPGPAARRQGPGELMEKVAALLPRLPELFTKDDVVQALAETPDRGSLFRVLKYLEAAGSLRVEHFGRGRYPTVYRRMIPAGPGPNDAAASPQAGRL